MDNNDKSLRDSPARKSAVLVTGASSGIGKACALKLHKEGYLVYCGLRDQHDERLLADDPREGMRHIYLDVTNEMSIMCAADKIESELRDLPFLGLVNNAGVLVSGPIEFTPLPSLRRQIEVNLIGQVAVAQRFLPLLRTHKARIVNIGSTSGKIVSAFLGPYCASKFALEAITEALRLELQKFDVKVSIVRPGVINTRLWTKVLHDEEVLLATMPEEGRCAYGASLMQRRKLVEKLVGTGESPQAVADVVYRALTSMHPKSQYVVGINARMKLIANEILPNHLIDKLKQVKQRASSL